MSIKKNISTYSVNLSIAELQDLKTLFSTYNSIKSIIYQRYSSINSYHKLKNHRRDIRDVLTREGFLNLYEIPARYVRMAIDDSIGNIKSMWTTTFKQVKSLISKNNNLSNEEKHYLFYMLKSDFLIADIMRRKRITVPEKFALYNLNINKLHGKLCSYIRKSLPLKSKSYKFGSMIIDQELYTYNGNKEISLSWLTKGKRKKISLTTDVKLEGNIRLVLELDKKRIRFSNCIDVEQTVSYKEEKVVGVDKNYVTVLDSDSGGKYGEDFGELQNKYTDILCEKDKKRQVYYNLRNKYKKKGDWKKVNNIEKYNLGKKKYNRKKNRHIEECKKRINRAIKNLVRDEKPSIIVCEELNFVSNNKRRNKKSKNKLNRFMKGLVQERLEYIGKLNGIEIKKVNAAYTSQICDHCGSEGNRKGDIFHCQGCGKVGCSGQIAASVIKSRINDQEITLGMNPRNVKDVINKRRLREISLSFGEIPTQPRPMIGDEPCIGANYQKVEKVNPKG